MPVDVLVAAYNTGAVEARRQDLNLPIVIASAYHPDEYGIVKSLAKPGGMVTGALLEPGRGINAKRIALLKETVPRLRRIAYLAFEGFGADVHAEVQAAGKEQSVAVFPVFADTPGGFERAFAEAARNGAGALIVGSSPIYLRRETQQKLNHLAIKYRLPVMHCLLAPGEAGGMMAYATDLRENYRIAARLVDKILRGAHPGDLPMEQAVTFRLTVDLRAAKASGLTIPPSVIAQADKVYE